MTESISEKQSLIFAGGGTGGHLLPGIAVAEELDSLGPYTITFIGSNRPVEQQIIERSGFRHLALASSSTADLKRAPWRFFWNNSRAYFQARRILKAERPTVVIGLGGFASVPVVLAANWLKIPVVLLEQNIIPGRANRFLFSRATLVCTSFIETLFPMRPSGMPRIVCTGNPVRRQIAQIVDSQQAVSDETLLLILGGSQGALAVNQAVLSLLEQDRQSLPHRLHVVHQTGQTGWPHAAEVYQRLQADDPDLKVTVEPFFSDLTEWYSRAGLVISRAGATTLAELACIGCPTVLIPYPNSIGDHQLVNARFYESQGAALLVEQNSDPAVTGQLLRAAVADVLSDSSKTEAMSEAMRRLALPQAAGRVSEEIIDLAAK